MKTNFFEFFHDFIGDQAFSTTKASNSGHPFTVTQTAAAGSPTIAVVDGSAAGELQVVLAATNEIENVCVSFGDKLCIDIDKIVEFGCRVKMNQATLNAATSFAIGLTGDRNDAIDSIAQAALFRLIGASDAILVETDDGTHDNDDIPTGQKLGTDYVDLLISFATGKHDVRFFVNGQPVATSTEFNMAAYSGSLQLFLQLQKTAATAVDGVTIDHVYVSGRR